MYHYTARIICNKCKVALIAESGSKQDCPSMKSLAKSAKDLGWEVKRNYALCERCRIDKEIKWVR